MTNFMILVIIFHALFYAGNCCLIFRLCANDVRSSVLQEMLLPWLNNTVGSDGYNYLKADKILGHEYNTMYFTVFTKYGIPLRAANINDKTTSLFDMDTSERHSSFWTYTLIPILHQFEQILESQFFTRFGLKEQDVFDLWDIPELQEREDAQSKRDIAKINAGLKTINDVLREQGKDTKPKCDKWYKPQNFIAVMDGKPPEKGGT